jgi:hypothetical protein
MSFARLRLVDLALNLTENHHLWMSMLNLAKMVDSLLLSAKYLSILTIPYCTLEIRLHLWIDLSRIGPTGR